MRAIYEKYAEELDALKASGNLRTLPSGLHEGRWILSGGQRMLNLSTNDYLTPENSCRCPRPHPAC